MTEDTHHYSRDSEYPRVSEDDQEEFPKEAAAEAEACGDEVGSPQYGDPWVTHTAAVALRLLTAEEQRNKSTTTAHATPAAKGALSTNEMARQPVYETALDLRLKQREPDQDLDRLDQSPAIILPGLQQQPRAGPLYPVPSSWSSSGVSVTPGRKGGATKQPSLQEACCPNPPPQQDISSSTSASSSVQQQPSPTPRGSSSSGGGKFRFLLPCRGQGLAFKQVSAADKAIYQNQLLPHSPISENLPAAPIGAVAVKRSIRAGVKVRPSESVCRRWHGGQRNEGEPMALAPMLKCSRICSKVF
ncbi:hypothetical protein HPB49_004639 [Dermacentor silvarum]|uniref:Uncharacterized protein n=1 Tax=Dermacentor silvarum TaxID=543639 RepID=A0ACB8DMH7_DERSI|nr:hypothetical protein HPB49_004639 [Dermacentor silvarum]